MSCEAIRCILGKARTGCRVIVSDSICKVTLLCDF